MAQRGLKIGPRVRSADRCELCRIHVPPLPVGPQKVRIWPKAVAHRDSRFACQGPPQTGDFGLARTAFKQASAIHDDISRRTHKKKALVKRRVMGRAKGHPVRDFI